MEKCNCVKPVTFTFTFTLHLHIHHSQFSESKLGDSEEPSTFHALAGNVQSTSEPPADALVSIVYKTRIL